jgi:hypothetical protein
MKKNTRNITLVAITVVLALTAVFVVYVVVPVATVVMAMKTVSDRANRGQEHLFYETDYGELLAACRELSQRVAEGNLQPKQYNLFWEDPDPNVSTFPQVILDLEPSFVSIDADGVVDLELLPGPEYFGVFAFPEGQKDRDDVKLIDGLWYYDSEYRDEYPKYMKRIDAMIDEGRKRKAARAATQSGPPPDEQVAH